jgi:hypothetical protein
MLRRITGMSFAMAAVRHTHLVGWADRRAMCYLSILKPQQAIADFKKSVQLDPKNANAKIQLDATVKVSGFQSCANSPHLCYQARTQDGVRESH